MKLCVPNRRHHSEMVENLFKRKYVLSCCIARAHVECNEWQYHAQHKNENREKRMINLHNNRVQLNRILCAPNTGNEHTNA